VFEFQFHLAVKKTQENGQPVDRLKVEPGHRLVFHPRGKGPPRISQLGVPPGKGRKLDKFYLFNKFMIDCQQRFPMLYPLWSAKD
jgi:hypothetical protein